MRNRELKARNATDPAKVPGVIQTQRCRAAGPTLKVRARLGSTVRKTATHRMIVASQAAGLSGWRPSARRICGQATMATRDPSRTADRISVRVRAVRRTLTNERFSATPKVRFRAAMTVSDRLDTTQSATATATETSPTGGSAWIRAIWSLTRTYDARGKRDFRVASSWSTV